MTKGWSRRSCNECLPTRWFGQASEKRVSAGRPRLDVPGRRTMYGSRPARSPTWPCATAATPQRPADARSPTTRSSFAADAPRRCSATGLEPAGPIIPPRFPQLAPVSAGERRGAHRLPRGQASSERRREVSRRLPGGRMDSRCDGGRVRAGPSGDRAGSSRCPRPPPARRRHVGVPRRRTLEANSAASVAPDRRPRPSRRNCAPFPPSPESGSRVVDRRHPARP